MNNFVWGNNMKKIVAVGFIVILILCLSLVAISCTSIESKTYESKTYKGEYCGRTCSITINFYTGEWSYSGAKLISGGNITCLSLYDTVSVSEGWLTSMGVINGRTKYYLSSAGLCFSIYVDSDQQTLLIVAPGASTGIKCTLSN